MYCNIDIVFAWSWCNFAFTLHVFASLCISWHMLASLCATLRIFAIVCGSSPRKGRISDGLQGVSRAGVGAWRRVRVGVSMGEGVAALLLAWVGLLLLLCCWPRCVAAPPRSKLLPLPAVERASKARLPSQCCAGQARAMMASAMTVLLHAACSLSCVLLPFLLRLRCCATAGVEMCVRVCRMGRRRVHAPRHMLPARTASRGRCAE